MRDCAWVPGVFPNIRADIFACTSDSTIDRVQKYNCIAWAAGKTDNWWWPSSLGGYFWPEGLDKELPNHETVATFVRAFGTVGYVVCYNSDFEAGFEKIALYTNDFGRPAHAARMLETGEWSSKLGDREDISHKTLAAVEGAVYGKAIIFLKRSLA